LSKKKKPFILLTKKIIQIIEDTNWALGFSRTKTNWAVRDTNQNALYKGARCNNNSAASVVIRVIAAFSFTHTYNLHSSISSIFLLLCLTKKIIFAIKQFAMKRNKQRKFNLIADKSAT
jgi:1,4-alpha-glucan branching enzyme